MQEGATCGGVGHLRGRQMILRMETSPLTSPSLRDPSHRDVRKPRIMRSLSLEWSRLLMYCLKSKSLCSCAAPPLRWPPRIYTPVSRFAPSC